LISAERRWLPVPRFLDAREKLVEKHRPHRVFAYHGWFDGNEASYVDGSERVVAAKCVVAVGADEHAESVIAIKSTGIIVLN
jgi:hypothetical protein